MNNRELLPENFYIKTKNCMDKNRAIVMMLHKFGIRVHGESAMTRSLEFYNNRFNNGMNLQVINGRLTGTGSTEYDRLKINELLEAYGKLT
jgi:hypothetical protein